MTREELTEKLESAKNAEDMKEILAEMGDRTKLSMEELDRVAGGSAPEKFMWGDLELTRQEVIKIVDDTCKYINRSQGKGILEQIVCPYYQNYPREKIIRAYEQYGADMFDYLDKPGWKGV